MIPPTAIVYGALPGLVLLWRDRMGQDLAASLVGRRLSHEWKEEVRAEICDDNRHVKTIGQAHGYSSARSLSTAHGRTRLCTRGSPV
jgi:hypothetical protein